MSVQITPTPITDAEYTRLVKGGEYLGGYGWAWDGWLSRWVAGARWALADGRLVCVEKRSKKDPNRDPRPEIVLFVEKEAVQ